MALTLNGDNTASTPGYAGSDSDTGLQPGTNELDLVTGGTSRVKIDSSGNVGIGTTSPSNTLDIVKTGSGDVTTARIASTGTSGVNDATLILNNGGTGNATLRFDYETATNRASIYVPTSAQELAFSTNGNNERMRLDSSGNLKFNSGYGSVATAYGVRAWVCFNGTGTIAIKNDGNVSSLTDLDTGKYRINFTNSMPDVNYCTCASIIGSPSSSNPYTNSFVTTNENSGSVSTGHIEIRVIHTSAGLQDHSNINVAVIR
jgi:hypothetical protein